MEKKRRERQGKVKLFSPEERCSGNYVRYYESKCRYCAKRPTRSCSGNWTGTTAVKRARYFRNNISSRAPARHVTRVVDDDLAK